MIRAASPSPTIFVGTLPAEIVSATRNVTGAASLAPATSADLTA